MFAILGAYFFDLLVKEKVHPAARTIFALCFSIAIAVLWEFCEFGADRFLGMDMQDDMLVTYLLILLDKGKHPMIRDVHNMQDTDCPVKKEEIR